MTRLSHDGNTVFQTGKGVYIALPQDFGREKGSGKRTQDILVRAFNDFPRNAVPAREVETPEQAAVSAKAAGCAYVVHTKIVLWEDPPTFITNARDKGEIVLSVFDVETVRLLRNDILECSKQPFTINGIGSSDPGDCLLDLAETWRAGAFQ